MACVIWIAVVALMVVSLWKVFVKAGQPGWAAIIPIYNWVILLRMAGKPEWWVVVILLVPIANLVLAIMAMIALAERFGKGAGFGVGLALLGIIFFPILAFSDAQYLAAGSAASAVPPVQPPVQR